MKKRGNLFAAVAILAGTAIGAGYLGIPYVVAQSGFAIGLFHLVLIGIVILLINLYYGEIILRSSEQHHLPGQAEKYLGKKGKLIVFIGIIFLSYSALIAYLIGEGESISTLIFNTPKYSLYISIVFWILMTLLSYGGLKRLKKVESYGVSIMATIAMIIVFSLLKNINMENLETFHLNKTLIPMGVIIFAYLAFSELKESSLALGNNRLFKKAIIIGTLIPFIVYTLLTLAVVGYFGTNVPEIFTLGLSRFFISLGIITMLTSFAAINTSLIDMYEFDFKIPKQFALLLVNAIVLILFVIIKKFSLATFINIIGISGAISGGILALIILLINKRAKYLGDRKPEFSMPINWLIISVISVVFALAVIMEIMTLIR